MTGLGDHEAGVRVLGVAQEMLVAAGVVEADDRGPDHRRPAEREEGVGVVVGRWALPRPGAGAGIGRVGGWREGRTATIAS